MNVFYICNYTLKNQIYNLQQQKKVSGQKSLLIFFNEGINSDSAPSYLYDPSGIIESGNIIKVNSIL